MITRGLFRKNCRNHALIFFCGVIPRQEIFDLALLVPADDCMEGFHQVCLWIDPVEFCCLDQRGDDAPVFGSGIMAGEERVFPIEGDRADRAFDRIIVQLDTAILEEQD